MNDASTNDSRENPKPLLWDLIRNIRFAMFTTQQLAGGLRSRPMTTQNKGTDEDTSLWFFMSRKGEPVQDLQAQPQVGVAYADPDNNRYVSVSGNAAVVEDKAKKEQLWTKMAQAWFPGGVSDPDLALVRVEISQAEYWDTKANKMVQLAAIAKAVITGKPPTDLGAHGEVRMR